MDEDEYVHKVVRSILNEFAEKKITPQIGVKVAAHLLIRTCVWDFSPLEFSYLLDQLNNDYPRMRKDFEAFLESREKDEKML